MSETPVSYRRAPPTLGQDTREVLQEVLQIETAECDRLAALGAI
jgi:crotonobetainyl-CoA:carnitine CoA-transferase CaiB-like acyl-CoA transferase